MGVWRKLAVVDIVGVGVVGVGVVGVGVDAGL
jgi:hypothetical protein